MDFKLKLKRKVLRPSPVLCLPPLYLRLRLLSGVSLLPLTMMMMMMMMAAAPHRLPMKTSSSNSPSSRPRDRKNEETISMTLVGVLHLLLSKKIKVKFLDAAEYNLKIFLQSFEKLYGNLLFSLFFFLTSESRTQSLITSHCRYSVRNSQFSPPSPPGRLRAPVWPPLDCVLLSV